ncbi:hypothetical protein M378DRAFT_171804 [Amanita muscaria Koide BX008]|uniref:Uncharacterized protein n=1 Tax=Amanita muscaria (strain Koide BX008) TaxID=946122 RepID=A0A0C2WL20_AMAMK|nr:hypothetical protein M378DRAFT_171804 [Amanita muscaria Koide BX008]
MAQLITSYASSEQQGPQTTFLRGFWLIPASRRQRDGRCKVNTTIGYQVQIVLDRYIIKCDCTHFVNKLFGDASRS